MVKNIIHMSNLEILFQKLNKFQNNVLSVMQDYTEDVITYVKKTERTNNVCEQLSPNLQEKVVSKIIREKFNKANSQNLSFKTGGVPLSIELSQHSTNEEKIMSHKSLMDQKLDANLTDNQILKICRNYREFSGRKSIDPNFREFLVDQKTIFHDYFDSKY